MPNYTFKCDNCETIYPFHMSLKEHEEEKNNKVCSNPQCGTRNYQYKLHQVILTAPQINTLGGFRYNTKVRVPINLIEERPDGTVRVTRIGSKKDIDNGE